MSGPRAAVMVVAGIGLAMFVGWITLEATEPLPPITQPRYVTPYVIPTPLPTPTMVPFFTHGSPAPMGVVRNNLGPWTYPYSPPPY